MTARRRSDDADLPGIDLPFLGMKSHEANGALHILEHRGVVITRRAKTRLQNERCHTLRPQPDGVIFSLVRGEMRVAAAGTDNHGRACGRFTGGGEERKRGDVFGRICPPRSGERSRSRAG